MLDFSFGIDEIVTIFAASNILNRKQIAVCL